jgi:hypothetical protein
VKILGVTPFRFFLIFWAVFSPIVVFALLGHHWAIVACRLTEYAAGAVGMSAFIAVYVLKGWERYQQRKGGIR